MSDESKPMGLKLYNTLTRHKEDFKPIDPEHVGMYVCGPTVYDYAHIGNARPVIVFDVLYRLLRHIYGKTHVKYVRNITDVDDKINARAAEEFPDDPLNEAIARVTTETGAQYERDMTALGNLRPDVEPRATDHIDQMKRMIATLIENGNAYVAENHVLFHVNSWTDEAGNVLYGKLSRRSLDEMIAGARVDVAPYKKDPMDFVLWKPSRAGEPGWESDWGLGRPGWHIECSAMSKEHLGEVFDIHGGGIDLVFPHHENEIAQSRCADGTERMANVWMHNGFLQVEGEKMSKSLGNFVTVHDLLETEKFGGRKWPGAVLRLAMLMTHYRKPIDFSVRRLTEAEEIISRIVRPIKHGSIPGWSDFVTDEAREDYIPHDFLAALKNDLDIPRATRLLQPLSSKAFGTFFGSGVPSDEPVTEKDRELAARQLIACLSILGMESVWEEPDAEHPEIQALIDARNTARMEKNFAEADRLREELSALKVQVLDYKDPDTGEFKSNWEIKR